MPATDTENRPPPGNSLVLGCYNCSRLPGSQVKNTRKTYLDLLNILKFDESDPILGSNHGGLSCIFALITGDNVEFNLCELVRDWLLDSTAPVFVNEC